MICRWLLTLAILLSPLTRAPAQEKSGAPPPGHSAAKPASATGDPSGMYMFLKDGEYVQLNIEDGKLAGYISRYGNTESDQGQFIAQFFDKASLEGNHLAFTTKVVHGVSYEFKGIVTVTPGKLPRQEGYRVLKGTLTETVAAANGNDKTTRKEVELKSFPPDMGPS